MPAGLERPPTALQQGVGIGMPVQRVHADQDVEAARARERGVRDVEVLEGQAGAAGLVLLARDLDQMPHAVDPDHRVAFPGESEADVPDPTRHVEHARRARLCRIRDRAGGERDDLLEHALVRRKCVTTAS